VGNLVAALLQIYFSICVPQIMEISGGLTVFAKKRCNIFCPTV